MKIITLKKIKYKSIIYDFLGILTSFILISETQAAEMYIGGESKTVIDEEQQVPGLVLTGDYKLYFAQTALRADCVKFRNLIIGWRSLGTFKDQHVNKLGQENSHWLSPHMPNERVQPRIILTGEIINACKSPQQLHIDITMLIKNDAVEKSLMVRDITLPSPEICSVRLTPDYLSFGPVAVNQTYHQLLQYDGEGDVEITSSSMRRGHLRLNNDAAMDISVPQNFVSATNSWKTSRRLGDIPLTLEVGENAAPGKYRATLTATLTCP